MNSVVKEKERPKSQPSLSMKQTEPMHQKQKGMKNLQEEQKPVGKLNVSDWLQVLSHVSACTSSRCDIKECKRIKKMLSHTRDCKDKIHSNCAICKQFLHLCIMHSKTCSAMPCRIYLCSLIKRRIAQRQDLAKHSLNTRLVKSVTIKGRKYMTRSDVNEAAQSRSSKSLLVSNNKRDFKRSLSLQIPVTKTSSWVPFNRMESLEMKEAMPELIGATEGLIKTVDSDMKIPVLMRHNTIEIEETMEE